MRTSVYEEMTARMKKLFENLSMDDLFKNETAERQQKEMIIKEK